MSTVLGYAHPRLTKVIAGQAARGVQLFGLAEPALAVCEQLRLRFGLQLNIAWMWGALLAASMTGWLHQLTATTAGPVIVAGHGTRGGKAMIATLRWRLIAIPGRLIRHVGQLILRLPPGQHLPAEVLARLRALPAMP